jgi:hypothetical protein
MMLVSTVYKIKTVKNIQEYIESCLKRSEKSYPYLLQCQSCSGSAKEKIAMKMLEAEQANEPTWVLWFGNGFDLKFIEKCQKFPVRGNYLGLLSVGDFCEMVIKNG